MNCINSINCHRVLLTVSLEDVSWISWIPPHFKGRVSQLLQTQPDAFDALVDVLQAVDLVYLVHWMVNVSKMNQISQISQISQICQVSQVLTFCAATKRHISVGCPCAAVRSAASSVLTHVIGT